jgi:hypothetical protein
MSVAGIMEYNNRIRCLPTLLVVKFQIFLEMIACYGLCGVSWGLNNILKFPI